MYTQSTFEDIYCNKAEIQKRMTFSALFVMAYEQMVHEWREMLKDFLLTPFVDNGNLQYESKEADAFNKKYGKASLLFDWFYQNNLINKEQQEKLKLITAKRNLFVHEYHLMTNPIQEEDRQLFKDLIEIRKTISRNWILEIEVPTNPPELNEKFINEEGNFQQPTNAFDVTDLLLDIMIESANLKE